MEWLWLIVFVFVVVIINQHLPLGRGSKQVCTAREDSDIRADHSELERKAIYPLRERVNKGKYMTDHDPRLKEKRQECTGVKTNTFPPPTTLATSATKIMVLCGVLMAWSDKGIATYGTRLYSSNYFFVLVKNQQLIIPSLFCSNETRVAIYLTNKLSEASGRKKFVTTITRVIHK